MTTKCVIKFDNNQHGIYFAGQMLTGSIELTVDKAKKTKGVCLKIEGYAKCHWTETQHHGTGKNRTSRTIHFSGREDYINTISYLAGGIHGKTIELMPGQHRYQFSCILPPLLPTSIEAQHGHIRYVVKVVLERSWKFDLTYTTAFTVLKPLDLNYESPMLRNPIKMEINKTFSFGIFKSDPLHMSVSIPFSGFVAGQPVSVAIEINNQSRVAIDDVKISLKKTIHYNSQTPRNQTKEQIVSEFEHRCGGIAARNKGMFDFQLVIPLIPPTNLTCRVITVSYALHVTGKVSGLHRSPIIRIPITIGTVPLESYQNVVTNQQMNPQVQTNPYAPHLPPPITGHVSATSADSPMSHMAPPSYMEAMSNTIDLREEGEHTMGQNVYTPRYPVYNFNNPGDQSLNAPNYEQFNISAQSYGFNLPAASSQVSGNNSEKKENKLL